MTSTEPPPLSASLAKVKSAYSKLAELTGMINGFLKQAKLRTRTANNYYGITYVIAGLDRSPGEDISLKIGEIAVQLRDALDKMAVALVAKNGRGVSGVHFPFGGLDKTTGKSQPFPEARHSHLEKKFTPEQWALILAQKPHPGGNDTLWAVNQLANNDKHWEHLIAVDITPVLANLTIVSGYVQEMVTHPDWPKSILKQHKTEKALLSVRGPPPNMQAAPRVFVVFGDIPPIAGHEVLGSLNSQAAEVERIVKLFGETFWGPDVGSVVQSAPS